MKSYHPIYMSLIEAERHRNLGDVPLEHEHLHETKERIDDILFPSD